MTPHGSNPVGELPTNAENGGRRTYYASPERTSPEMLSEELSYIDGDPVIDALLWTVSGLVAVLDQNRQVLALNAHMLEVLGVKDPESVLGLRLGDAVGCVYASRGSGCGTTEYCSTCGAAIATVTSLATSQKVERICSIQLSEPKNGSDHLYFRVQACPILRGGHRIVLVFMQDVSEEQRRALINRTFYHDVRNSVCAILTASELLAMDGTRPDARIATTLLDSTRRLAREIEFQRCLAEMTTDGFTCDDTTVPVATVLAQVAAVGEHHPSSVGKTLSVAPCPASVPPVRSDPTLVHRVLQNMVINAFEATEVGGVVRLWADAKPNAVEFCVWNKSVIPSDVGLRVFQRNFSTKGGIGRGIGTYSMKLIGERMLRGSVSFTSVPGEGTCFRFRLPAGEA